MFLLKGSRHELSPAERLVTGPVFAAEEARRVEESRAELTVFESMDLPKSESKTLTTDDISEGSSLLAGVILGEGEAAMPLEIHDASRLIKSPIEGSTKVSVVINEITHAIEPDAKVVITGVAKKKDPSEPSKVVAFWTKDGTSTIGSKKKDGTESPFASRFDKADGIDAQQLSVEVSDSGVKLTTVGDTKVELRIPHVETAAEKGERVDKAASKAGELALTQAVDMVVNTRSVKKTLEKDSARSLKHIREQERDSLRESLKQDKKDTREELRDAKNERAMVRLENNRLGRFTQRFEMRRLVREATEKRITDDRAAGKNISRRAAWKMRHIGVRTAARKMVNAEASKRLSEADRLVNEKRAAFQRARNAKQNNSSYRFAGGTGSMREARMGIGGMSTEELTMLRDRAYNEEQRKQLIKKAEERMRAQSKKTGRIDRSLRTDLRQRQSRTANRTARLAAASRR